MRRQRRYAIGLVVVAAGTLAVAAMLPAEAARGLRLALGLALAVQGPLGWWLVRSIGRPGFLGIWAVGMLGRVALLGLAALGIVPALGWPPAPTLFSLAGLLLALLGLEAVVLLVEQSQAEEER